MACSDEKLFLLQLYFNPQNEHLLGKSSVEISGKFRPKIRRLTPNGVILDMAMCTILNCPPLWVKIFPGNMIVRRSQS